jgi:RHS repeat-associated protein
MLSFGSCPFTWSEAHIYGSDRIGILNINLPIVEDNERKIAEYLLDTAFTHILAGMKKYELTNHLGNVLSVITDRRLYEKGDDGSQYFVPDVVSATDYYPFGWAMPGRTYTAASYKYGFNGKENDNEVKGEGNQQDYGMRIYDPRLGRFLSVDPISKEYPELTPYQFASNTPIWAIDLDGLEARIYTETTGGTGHAFITVKSGKDVIVYSYGRYGKIDYPKLGRLSPTGEGVLLKYTGKDATDFIKKNLYKYDAKVFEITDVNDNKVAKHFDKAFNASNKIPTEGSAAGNKDARVIDNYNLLNNNCSTTSCDAVNDAGSNALNKPEYPNAATGTPDKDRSITPIGLEGFLEGKSDGNSPVKDVTKDVKTEYPKHKK